MRGEILEYIDQFAGPWKARKLQTRPDYMEYLSTVFPLYDDAADYVYMLVRDYTTQKTCVWCDGRLNNIKKETCSHACRISKQKNEGYFETRIDTIRKTCIERYGVDSPAKVPEIQQKRLDTMVRVHGGKVSEKSRQRMREDASELNRKGRETLKKIYGVDNPGQIPGHGDRIKNTLIDRYGVDNIMNIPEVKQRRKEERFSRYSVACNDVSLIDISAPDAEYVKLYPTAHDIMTFKCDTCGETNSTNRETYMWRIRATGTPCPICSELNKGSVQESEVAEWIRSNGISVIRNDRSVIAPYEIDILIPSHNLAIEYNGLYWHRDVNDGSHLRDMNKREMVERKGIRLIQIFEDEWVHSPDIVKSRLSHILGITKGKCYGRNTVVVELSTTEAKSFVDSNHLQGYAPSSVKLGLQQGDDLVAVMTFSKQSISKSGNSSHWEISRFCLSAPVVGGASKLISYFVKNWDITELISYADRRWGNGQVYRHAGMEFSHNTRPGYWYIDAAQSRRIHRFALRKNKDDDPNLTEWENRQKQGWNRIWDCGHAKYIWKKGCNNS